MTFWNKQSCLCTLCVVIYGEINNYKPKYGYNVN